MCCLLSEQHSWAEQENESRPTKGALRKSTGISKDTHTTQQIKGPRGRVWCWKPQCFSKACRPTSHLPTKAHDRNSNTSVCHLIEAPLVSLGDGRLVFREHLCPAAGSSLIIFPQSPPPLCCSLLGFVLGPVTCLMSGEEALMFNRGKRSQVSAGIQTYHTSLPLGMLCVFYICVWDAVTEGVFDQGGVDSQALSLLVSPATKYMVEDSRKTTEEIQVDFTEKHQLTHTLTHTHTEQSCHSWDLSHSPETDSLPDRQEVGSVCVWSSEMELMSCDNQSERSHDFAYGRRGVAFSLNFTFARLSLSYVCLLTCQEKWVWRAQSCVCFPAHRMCLAMEGGDDTFYWQSWHVTHPPLKWSLAAVIREWISEANSAGKQMSIEHITDVSRISPKIGNVVLKWTKTRRTSYILRDKPHSTYKK